MSNSVKTNHFVHNVREKRLKKPDLEEKFGIMKYGFSVSWNEIDT